MSEQIKIIDVADVLSRAGHLIECASCAAESLWGKEADPVDSTLEVASKKIDEAIAMLDEYHKLAELAGIREGEAA
jgi:hypothetical protein